MNYSKFKFEKVDMRRHEAIFRKLLSMNDLEAPQTFVTIPPTGYVVYLAYQPVCMGFMVKCDNLTAIFQDFVSNPKFPKEERNHAVQFLRELLALEARDFGIKVITSYTRHEGHVKRLASLGFKAIDTNLTQMGRELWL